MRVWQRLLGREAAAYGDGLAREVARRYPLPPGGKGLPKISVDRLTRILEGSYTKAQTYQAEHRLGWFNKARLCHAFKWRLLELGYDRVFADMATEGLVVYLSKPVEAAPGVEQAQKKRARKPEKAKEPTRRADGNDTATRQPN